MRTEGMESGDAWNELSSGRKDLITIDGGVMMWTHGPAVCMGDFCCIHRPSDHPLRNAPMVWWPDLKMMFRRCACDKQHPDPDSLEMKTILAWALGCGVVYDGWHPCCDKHCCRADDQPATGRDPDLSNTREGDGRNTGEQAA